MVAVKRGETTDLAFGPPFRSLVTAQRANEKAVYLGLTIVGAANERCTDLRVNGSRPAAPTFVVKDGHGKVVGQGRFEYG
jgi:hypothetical protein